MCGDATPDNRAPQPTSFFKETSGKCTCQVADDRARTGSERPDDEPRVVAFRTGLTQTDQLVTERGERLGDWHCRAAAHATKI
ncbi:hypothetical protein GCM10010217_69850 [Streptomyces tubercidicus]